MTFDIKVDAELQPDAFIHSLLQSWDLLSSKLVPGDQQNKARFTSRLTISKHFFFFSQQTIVKSRGRINYPGAAVSLSTQGGEGETRAPVITGQDRMMQ